MPRSTRAPLTHNCNLFSCRFAKQLAVHNFGHRLLTGARTVLIDGLGTVDFECRPRDEASGVRAQEVHRISYILRVAKSAKRI